MCKISGLRSTLIVPLNSSFVLDFLEDLVNDVKEVFSKAGLNLNLTFVTEVLKPSIRCYDWNRLQYRAPCIIEQLHEEYGDLVQIGSHLIVGVGYVDGYDIGLNFVFGEADPSIGVAVVFTKRLDPTFYGRRRDYNLYYERMVKEVVHELGHLFHLKHCRDRKCVMSFSNSVEEVDAKTRSFCLNCIDSLRRSLT